VSAILVGGMGRGAQMRMAELGIEVVAGLPLAEPRALVQAWLDGQLTGGPNACEGHQDHHADHPHGDGHCNCSH
jgi:predicted Fe-Mo cluster-binding NifX family protein